MAHTGTLFQLYLLTMYLLQEVTSFLESKEAFYTLLISHTHTTGAIYLIFIDPITLTL